jgi:hypothetical protein
MVIKWHTNSLLLNRLKYYGQMLIICVQQERSKKELDLSKKELDLSKKKDLNHV